MNGHDQLVLESIASGRRRVVALRLLLDGRALVREAIRGGDLVGHEGGEQAVTKIMPHSSSAAANYTRTSARVL